MRKGVDGKTNTKTKTKTRARGRTRTRGGERGGGAAKCQPKLTVHEHQGNKQTAQQQT